MISRLRILSWIFLLFFNVYTCGIASEEAESEAVPREDPSFFRIRTLSGREIYFLGVVHGIPFEHLLPEGTRREILRLHSVDATLFLEHSLTNEHYLELLSHGEYLTDPDDRSSFF